MKTQRRIDPKDRIKIVRGYKRPILTEIPSGAIGDRSISDGAFRTLTFLCSFSEWEDEGEDPETTVKEITVSLGTDDVPRIEEHLKELTRAGYLRKTERGYAINEEATNG